MLTVVRPSPLRLWGFVLTVAGGAALAFGAIGDWAAVSLGGSTEHAVPTKGIDLWQGQVALALGALVVVAVLVLRVARPERRAAVAVAITALAVVALALTLWCWLTLDDAVSGADALVRMVVDQLGVSEAEARRLIQEATAIAGVDVRPQAGLWLSLAGSVLATVGGLLDLAWVRRKRELGGAIDVDTDPPEGSAGGGSGDPAGDAVDPTA